METLYVFMSANKVNTLYLQKQIELYPTKQIRQLQRLSDTRWTCRYLAVDAVCSTFGSIIATLQAVVNSEDRVKAVEATGILLQVRTYLQVSTVTDCVCLAQRVCLTSYNVSTLIWQRQLIWSLLP